MRDQAESLRELKANYDRELAKNRLESPQDFLAKIKRPSPFTACVMIYQNDLHQAKYGDIYKWLPKICKSPDSVYLWDQANIMSTMGEAASKSFPVMEKQPALQDLPTKSDAEKFSFIRNISDTLDKHNEIWITINSNELSNYSYLLKAADSICVMIPEHSEATVKSYELIKKLYSLGIETKIKLLEFSLKVFSAEASISNKIKSVAKQFLGIDLLPIGVVLSNSKYIPQINEGGSEVINTSADLVCGDFMYFFSESIVYPTSGTN